MNTIAWFTRYHLGLLGVGLALTGVVLPSSSVWSEEATLTTITPSAVTQVVSPEPLTAEATASSAYVTIPTPQQQNDSCKKQRQRLERLNTLWPPIGFVVSPYRAWAQAQYSQCLVPIAKQNQTYLQSIPANRPSIRIEED